MKKAFTMMELIFVIVVIGILAAIVIPRTGANKLREAATQVISHIRYTQHLAMVDDKFDVNDATWYEKRWQIIFGTSASTNNRPAYTIFSDTSGTGEPDKTEMAKNPLDSTRLLSGGYSGILHTTNDADEVTKDMNLGYYGIIGYGLAGGCAGARVSFDHLGRPFRGDLNTMTGAYSAPTQRLITAQCRITLTDGSDNIIIAIEPETGYAHIL